MKETIVAAGNATAQHWYDTDNAHMIIGIVFVIIVLAFIIKKFG